jgi:dipeptidyl aminopeptidase/acylaminoacyl peptidase
VHRRTGILAGAGGLALALVLTACTSAEQAGAPAADREPSRAPTTSPAATDPGSSDPEPSEPEPSEPEPSATEEAAPRPVSLPALFEKEYDGGALRTGTVLAETDAYTRYFVSYRSDGRRVSGILNVPRGRGPHPALVLAHGYIDPAYYVNGQGLMREQDWLARAGYVVLHTDYRNHAQSGNDPRAERRMRLGYTVDTINAVHALRRTRQVRVDDERVGLLGRSMGGGVVYNVVTAQPGLVDAAVVFAPVSSRTIDNFDRWIRDDPGRSALSDFILRRYGDLREAPRFWREVSPRPYFDRITEPVLIHHGTADESCPIRWSRATTRAMRAAGVDVRMHTYPGEPHAFVADWPLSMRRTTAFLGAHLA